MGFEPNLSSLWGFSLRRLGRFAEHSSRTRFGGCYRTYANSIRMMKRREFGEKLVNSAIGTCIVGSWPSKTASGQALRIAKKNALMHVGGDYHSVAGSGITSKENLEFNLRYGVKHITAQMKRRDDGWSLDELKKMKDDCDRYGVTFEAIRMDADYIAMRKGPERDRELDMILGNIQKASEVGIKIITYHWTVIPIRRNRQTTG